MNPYDDRFARIKDLRSRIAETQKIKAEKWLFIAISALLLIIAGFLRSEAAHKKGSAPLLNAHLLNALSIELIGSVIVFIFLVWAGGNSAWHLRALGYVAVLVSAGFLLTRVNVTAENLRDLENSINRDYQHLCEGSGKITTDDGTTIDEVALLCPPIDDDLFVFHSELANELTFFLSLSTELLGAVIILTLLSIPLSSLGWRQLGLAP